MHSHFRNRRLTSKTGIKVYNYNTQVSGCLGGTLSKPHAVSSAGSNAYSYDCNGNMTVRNVGSAFNYSYDAESHLTGVSGGISATFVYDGNGNRVKGTVGGVTTAYVGNHFEWTGSTSTMKKYYYAGGQRVAVRTGSSTLNFLLGVYIYLEGWGNS